MGDVHCDICSDFPYRDTSKFLEIQAIEDEERGWYQGLICLGCCRCLALRRKNEEYVSIESLLKDESKEDGWEESKNELVHSILNFVVYRINEPPNESEYECQYEKYPKSDKLFILWENQSAIGFCTVRPKECMKQSHMVVLDTLFISKIGRRKGWASCILKRLLRSEENLGLSAPISNAMLRLTLRYLKQNPLHRENVWLVDTYFEKFINLWWSTPLYQRQNI